MGASTFWRDLASQFRGLPDPYGMLRADWNYIGGTENSGHWTLGGGASFGLRVRFESLARRAGAAVDRTNRADLLQVWLDLIKQKTRAFHLVGYGVEEGNDGKSGACRLFGSIDRPCEASADLCVLLEIEAFEAERQRFAAPRFPGKSMDPPGTEVLPPTSPETSPAERVAVTATHSSPDESCC
jgi:hypothetical protein